MTYAPKPANERQRLASLHKLNILDTPIEERFERITRLVCRTLDVPISSFTIIDEGRQWFKSIRGLPGTESDLDVSFCSHVILEEEIMVVPDAREDRRFFENPLVTGNPNITFYAGCPVHSPDGHKIGSLCAVDSRVRSLTPDELQVLRDLAAMVETELRAAALSVSQSKLIEELDSANRLAMTDPLTRLWNRRGVMELMTREWAESIRNKKSIGVVMADIDFFKKINDTYGHAAGDAVLKNVGRELLAALRTEDILGRVGGEEFLMILPGCKPERLMQTVERIRQAVAFMPVGLEDGSMINVTMSFGAKAITPDGSASPELSIEHADKALYRAKENGRDRVEIYQ